MHEKLERLAERKKHLVSLLENLREDSERSEAAAGFKVSLAERAKDFNAGWKKATPSNKKRLVRRLIDKLIVTADGISAYYVLAEPKTFMTPSNNKKAPEHSSGALPNSLSYPDTRQTLSSGLASSESVPSLRNGGGGTRLSTPLRQPPIPHDIIRFFQKTKERIFDICAPLYEAGCSLREIEEKTGLAKSSIREALNRRGLTLRNA